MQNTTEKKWKIRFNAPYIIGNEIQYISEAILKGRLGGDGRFTSLCQGWLEKTLECHQVFMTHSATAALEMTSLLGNIGPGDEVIMPSFTFVTTATAFAMRGAVPVFVDIQPADLNIDPNLIERAITPRTKAIVPVHYAGKPCDMDRINQIAETNGLIVIEDAAHALLSKYNGRYLGTLGHFACLSFHETKNIISGEGGALIVNHPEYIDRTRVIWAKGTNRYEFSRGEVDKYTWVDLGSSYFPSELVCAFLYGQLENAFEIMAKRIDVCLQYQNRLLHLEQKGLIRIGTAENIEANEGQNGHIFYILTGNPKEREALIKHLGKNGIHAVFHYVPLHSSPAGKKFGITVGSMRNTDSLSGRLLRLPLHYGLTQEEVDQVADSICKFYQK
jgi:dTDP-4-amino-4,6-dideoxygalactose transaminase